MKKNSILFFIIIIIASSCKTSNLPEQNITKNIQAVDSLVKGKFIIVELNERKILSLMFDTGATSSAIFDMETLGGEEFFTSENSQDIKVKKAIGSAFSAKKYASTSFKTNIINSKNQQLIVTKLPKTEISCLGDFFNGDGVLGMDVFFDEKPIYPLLLNYEKNYIQLLGNFNFSSDYQEIEASFENRRIFIHGKVNGKPVKLLFDSGSTNFLYLNNNPFPDTLEKIEVNTMVNSADSFLSAEKHIIYQDVDFQIKGIPITKNVITISQNINNNSVGLPFINNYNWILDFKNEKLYAKKIKEFDSDKKLELIKSSSQVAAVINNKLLIIHSTNPTYKVGDEILSVDNEEITEENKCRIFKKLVKNTNWSEFSIKTKSL